MQRTFVKLDEAPRPYVTIDAPFDRRIVEASGLWGSDPEERSREFDNNVAAVDAYLTRVAELVESGWVELAPWLTYRRGSDEVRLRPPICELLQQEVDGAVQEESFDGVVAAIYAYNERAAALVDEGYEWVLPAWDAFADQLGDGFEPVVEYTEEDPNVVERKYYRRRDEPRDEFGPELWYRDGAPWRYNFQLQTKVSGPALEAAKPSGVRGVQTFHADSNYGPTVLFAPTGVIDSLSLFFGDDGKRLNLIFEDGRLHIETRDGVDGEGRSRGLWVLHSDGRRTEKTFDPPDVITLERGYDEHGELVMEGRRDPEGREIGTWFDTDDENRIIKEYSGPDQLASITWDRHDGTRELVKVFDDAQFCVRIELHDESGTLHERRIRHDDRNGWDVEEFAADERVVASGSLDDDGYRHGVYTMFDDDGTPTESYWHHGEEVAEPMPELEVGWNLFRHDDGRVRRAICKGDYSDDPLADFTYDEDFYDLSDERDGEFSQWFEKARELATEDSSREGFLQICRVVERAAVLDSQRVVDETVPYLREALQNWPSEIRMAPWLWINRLITYALPVEALHICSALSLTGATTAHYLRNPHYPLLRAWLEDYPEDGPAPDGISLSFRDLVAEQLRNARDAEPHERYHPTGELELDESYFHDYEDRPAVFGSPLFREVRVLDVSWEQTPHDFEWDYQGILDGRGLAAGEVAQQLASTRLEVLDLWGQCASPRDQFAGRAHPQRLSSLQNLKVLNVGGGHPFGDDAVRALAEACPQLEALSLRPGYAGQVLDGFDFDEWEDGTGRDSVYGRLHEHWSIYGNDDIEKMRISDAGWESLASLPLERITLGPSSDPDCFEDDVVVEVLTHYQIRDLPRIAAWEQYFDC